MNASLCFSWDGGSRTVVSKWFRCLEGVALLLELPKRLVFHEAMSCDVHDRQYTCPLSVSSLFNNGPDSVRCNRRIVKAPEGLESALTTLVYWDMPIATLRKHSTDGSLKSSRPYSRCKLSLWLMAFVGVDQRLVVSS